MTVSPIRSLAEAAEGATVQPGALPPGPIVTASPARLSGFRSAASARSPRARGYPGAAPARVLRWPWPRQSG